MFKSKNEFQLANLSVSKRIVDSQEFLKKVLTVYVVRVLVREVSEVIFRFGCMYLNM
jgi:hypothetical protein